MSASLTLNVTKIQSEVTQPYTIFLKNMQPSSDLSIQQIKSGENNPCVVVILI